MSEEFDAKVVIDTGDAVKALKGVVSELDKVNREAKKAGREGLADAAKASSELASKQAETIRSTKDMGGAIGDVTSKLSSMVPGLDKVSRGVMSVRSSAMSAASAMGPLGIVVGGATAALGMLAEHIVTAEQRTNSWIPRIDSMRASILASADAFSAARQELDRYNRLAAGTEPIRAQQDALMAAREEVNRLTAAVNRGRETVDRQGGLLGLAGQGGVAGAQREALATLERRLSEAQRRAGELSGGMRAANEAAEAAAREAAKIERETTAAAVAEKSRGDHIRSAVGARRDESAEMLRQAEIRRQQHERALTFWQQEEMREANRAQAAVEELMREEEFAMRDEEAKQTLLDKMLIQDEADEKRLKALAQIQDKEAKINQLEQERIRIAARANEGLNGALEIAVRTFETMQDTNVSFREALRDAVKEFLKSFAIEQAYKAVAALAEAISLTITNPPAAGTKYTAAAMHAGIAAAAGGAAVAIPSGGGGGGSDMAARPDAAGDQGGGGGGGSVVINYNTPVPEAEIGRMQARAQREAERTFGRV